MNKFLFSLLLLFATNLVFGQQKQNRECEIVLRHLKDTGRYARMPRTIQTQVASSVKRIRVLKQLHRDVDILREIAWLDGQLALGMNIESRDMVAAARSQLRRVQSCAQAHLSEMQLIKI